MIRNNQNRRRRSGSGNGPRPQQLAGGNNYGNRLDNRQRGNASQLLEKYRGLARDSQQAGDRVTAEYYLQYAEHYYRVLGDYRDRQGEPVRRPRDYEDEDSAGFNGMDQDMNGDEDEAEGETRRQPEGRTESRGEARRDDERSSRSERQAPVRSERDYGRDRADRGEREQPSRSRERDWNRDEPRRDDARRDDVRSDARVEGRRMDRRSPGMRPADPIEAQEEGPIPGLPGPATLISRRREQPSQEAEAEHLPAPVATETTPVEASSSGAVAGEEQPAPRRRGRPRKVVAEA